MDRAATDAEVIATSLLEASAFGDLYDRHARTLARYLIRRVGPDEGEVLLGELFRIAFETRHRYLPERPDALPWLYGIAANLVMKTHRSRARRASAAARLASQTRTSESFGAFEERSVEAIDATARLSGVAAALDALAQEDREVLLLYAWEDLSYAEIGVALGIPTGTVRSRLHRVRRILRELIGPGGEEADVQSRGAGGGST